MKELYTVFKNVKEQQPIGMTSADYNHNASVIKRPVHSMATGKVAFANNESNQMLGVEGLAGSRSCYMT